ncbi:hypothetical protein EYC80_006099 [Monilinia laxa]|uniref:Uncharacterized protein n=1 Tax=Monilinia laxa TaxID=61186 RepID=A0A5N6KGG7_MONLA|nr:hypothetical protein EYC80_006099 [Monilinia laxa]
MWKAVQQWFMVFMAILACIMEGKPELGLLKLWGEEYLCHIVFIALLLHYCFWWWLFYAWRYSPLGNIGSDIRSVYRGARW